MDLVRRGRLSVQRVTRDAWDVVVLLAENGGWAELDLKPKKRMAPRKGKGKIEEGPNDGSENERLSDSRATKTRKSRKRAKVEADEDFEDGRGSTPSTSSDKVSATAKKSLSAKRKRQIENVRDRATMSTTRSRSTRTKKFS
jgi:hypothetical protein